MLFYLFLLLIVLPLVEIAVLVHIGQLTAWWVPFAIVIVTGIVGTWLARMEGWKVLDRVREDLRAGQMPAESLLDAFLILLAGILFVLPGVLTDVVGIILIFPPSRSLVKRGLRAWFRRNVEVHMARLRDDYTANADGSFLPEHDKIIDARVVRTRVEDAKERHF